MDETTRDSPDEEENYSELSAILSENRPTWDEYFLLLAKLASTRSTCYSRPVGAVIVRDKRVLSTGYNGAPPGTWHCSDKKKCYWRQPENQVPGIEPKELSRAIHAEMNAIAHAARQGISIEGGSIYVTLSPCINCFKVLISAGIKKLFFEHIYDFNDQGGDQFLLDYYKQYEEVIAVRQLSLSQRSVDIAVDFISGITSKRRHDHYS